MVRLGWQPDSKTAARTPSETRAIKRAWSERVGCIFSSVMRIGLNDFGYLSKIYHDGTGGKDFL
jgi:hypothetical protein